MTKSSSFICLPLYTKLALLYTWMLGGGLSHNGTLTYIHICVSVCGYDDGWEYNLRATHTHTHTSWLTNNSLALEFSSWVLKENSLLLHFLNNNNNNNSEPHTPQSAGRLYIFVALATTTFVN